MKSTVRLILSIALLLFLTFPQRSVASTVNRISTEFAMKTASVVVDGTILGIEFYPERTRVLVTQTLHYQ